MMPDAEWEALKNKIEREFPVRLKLAELAGRPKINPKNYKACEEFDATIPELFLEIALNKPENVQAALDLINPFDPTKELTPEEVFKLPTKHQLAYGIYHGMQDELKKDQEYK